ncbi:MAG: TonB-dependent receptor [Rhodocyclaceae bacterium]|nr:TonB-dependent receptor [Rhodocyclaceae bacterium]
MTSQPMAVARRALILTLVLWHGAAATAGEISAEDGEALRNLLEILEEQTEIATKTRLNADYVPGLVTVLHGDEMAALGAHTVWDALRLVPGVEPSTDQIGGRQTLVRGVGGSFASGNMKILLNGRAMNSALSANANPVLNLPIEQVDSIEVVRGPGSAVHGEFAYAGVLNVITRKKGRAAFVRATEYDRYAAGGYANWNPAPGVDASVSLGGWHAAGVGRGSGRDALYGGNNAPQSVLSNAPGPVDDEMEQRSFLFDVSGESLSLSFAYVEDGNGDHFGTINVLDSAEARGVDYRNRYLMLNGSGERMLAQDLSATATLGWQYYENHFDIRLLPDGFTWLNAAFQPTVLPNGYVSEGYYEEQRFSAELDFRWEGWEGHRWLAGFAVGKILVGDSWQRNNVHPQTLEPVEPPIRLGLEDGVPWVSEARSRRIASVTLQDEYRLGEDVTVTAGLRYDDYSDFGANTSPRLAAVWRVDRRHVFKAQYAEAFRPPTFYESAFSSDEAPSPMRIAKLEPETIRSQELAYIYKSPTTEFRVTGFRSHLADLIVDTGILGFVNAPGVDLTGVELELGRRIGPTFRIDANLTVVDTERGDTGASVAGAAERLANVVLRYAPRASRNYALWLRHVSERAREPGDSRPPLGGYETVDLTASLADWPARGLSLRLGVSNLFDRDVRYPAFTTLDVLGQPIPSYADDYPQPGRSAWLQFQVEFR